MKAEIIVITNGKTDYTLRCFQSIRENSLNSRLIWIDRGSSRDSRDAVLEEIRKMPDYRNVWIADEHEPVKAMNVGVSLVTDVMDTDCKYVAFVSPDIEVTPGWLDRMIDVMERDPAVYAVGPTLDESAKWQSYLNANQVTSGYQIPEGFADMDNEERAAKVDYAYGDRYRRCPDLDFFCVVFRKEVFRIGMIDNNFCQLMAENEMKCALSWGTYVSQVRAEE